MNRREPQFRHGGTVYTNRSDEFGYGVEGCLCVIRAADGDGV
ncbi:MAG TPA: hypothetical protein VMX13_08425 [Sedimentisphaerales bacterium]|nr:hypothetical protein [Sedimentisphaerales bacterium]